MMLAAQSPSTSPLDDVSTSSGSIDLERSSSTTVSSKNEHKETETQQLVWKETVAVRRSKILVFLGIILAGVVGGITTSIVVKNDERNDFDAQVSFYLNVM
jgi:hypothetical protein